jgi:protein-S-isoprenylcysteine O-methyltransferase Ste14
MIEKEHEKNIIHTAGHIVYIVLYGLLILLCILFYNRANLEILLYAGWIILAFGVIFLFLASHSRKKGRVSEGKGSNKGIHVESGMYAFVRHPEFLGHIFIIFALILIAQYWLSLVIGAMLIVLLCLAMMEEEKRNIEKFGEGYKDYIQRVPRINLLVGIIKQMHYKKENEKDR